jgi:hypothetical protein
MSYILYISKINPPTQETIDRLIKIHQTPQDDVIVTDYDTKLDNGFKIERIDRVSTPPRTEPELKDYLGIKEYKFATRITAEENDKRIKLERELKEKAELKPAR